MGPDNRRIGPESGRPLVAAAVLAGSFLLATLGTAEANTRKRQVQPEPLPASEALVGPARLAVVSLARQHVTFYDAGGRSIRAPISSGQTGMDTPVGVYSILQKKVDHTSNIYDDAKMPFMQRITWSGVALHAGALPGYPASHGCVRLPLSFAEQIFEKTSLGTRVVISDDDVAPVPITHAALFQPRLLSEPDLPAVEVAAYSDNDPPMMPDVSGWALRHREQARLRADLDAKVSEALAAGAVSEPLKAPYEQNLAAHKKLERSLKAAEAQRSAAEKRAAAAEKTLAAAKKPKAIQNAEKALAKARTALEAAAAKVAPAAEQVAKSAAGMADINANYEEAEAATSAAAGAAAQARRKVLPVSVFISLETKKLYVRQGHAPVLEADVDIADPDTPIGTHIFTAVDYASDGNSVRWNVVSLARRAGYYDDDEYDEFGEFNRKRKRDVRPAQPTDASSAAAALERISIPPELKDQLSEYVWPGSSIIISDEPMHKKETNNHTDFVVLLSGYPQGGIKKRPPPPPSYYYDEGPWSFFQPQPYGRSANSRYYGAAPYGPRGYGPRPRYKKQPSLFSWW